MVGTLEDLYQQKLKAKDAMAAHMPTLRKLAEECFSAVEFGVRRASSTVAILAGLPKEGWLQSFDIEQRSGDKKTHDLIHSLCPNWYGFLEHSSLDAGFGPAVDLLLHDSLHNYDHLKEELSLHGDKVRKYLCFHDTESCGKHGQTMKDWTPDPRIKGIRPAIEEWLKDHHEWKPYIHHKHSNGFTVLRRDDST